MAVANSTYYAFSRVREMSPEAQDWAATDHNFEFLSLILKALEQHKHTAVAGINYPGFYTPLSAPIVSPQGTPGGATYSYYIVARGTIYKESPTGSTAIGNPTLTGSNFNRITWTAVAGATGYDLIRITGGATQGVIASNLSAGTVQFDDTGVAATAYTSTRQPALSEISSGGLLPSGGTVSVRLAYINSANLETEASPENIISLSPTVERPLTPQLVSTQTAASALPGGTYIYALTKKKGSGETVISDVLAVGIPYDTTFSTTISFDAINTYTDGTTALNVYRASGLSSAFQLVTTITSTSQTQFTDTNTIAPANVNIQPPAVTTFDASKKVRINWAALEPHPSDARNLRVYLSQQSGIWSRDHLLSEIDLTDGTPPTFLDYLGSETLLPGWPKEASQIPTSAPKINLGTEATGAPILTANMDFAGFQGLNLRLENKAGQPASPQNGFIYYDTSTSNVRAYINGVWTNWGTTSVTSYSHPAEEAGGHIAANIKHTTGSAVTAKTVLDYIVDGSTGIRKQVAKMTKVVGVSEVSITDTSAVLLPDMVSPAIAPDFVAQWLRVVFSGHFVIANQFATMTVAIEYDGSTIEETIRSSTSSTTNASVPIHIEYNVQLATTSEPKVIRVLWWVTGGSVTAVGTRRSLVTEVVF